MTSAPLQGTGLPFTANNRLHVVPPATITTTEAEQGVRIIDQALSATFG